MSFPRNTILAALFALGTLAVATQEAQACPPRGGGGYSRGFAGGYSSRSYTTPSYGSYNSYSTPIRSYSQPSYGTAYSQPVQISRPVQIAQPIQQVSQPRQIVQQPQTQAPQQQVQQAPPPQPTAPVQNNAAMSALQALGGFAPPQSPVPQQQPKIETPAHVGNWIATLGNGSTVQLSLQADGNFSWVATNKAGNSSSFSGTYTVSNGTLSLNRSNDGQTLGGSMTNTSNNGFSFKVAGNNAASIKFARS